VKNDSLAGFSLRKTPQSEKADPRQVANSAGGYTFTVSDINRLDRFLMLGTDGGTYYIDESTLTKDNATFVVEYAQTNGVELVDRVVAISTTGRAPRQNPAIFALAVAASVGDTFTRQYALREALPKVCRTGYSLFLFAGYIENMRGWGRALRHGVANWYTSKSPQDLEYQVLKYRQREGWTHRDLLRLSHPHVDSYPHNNLFRYVVGKDAELDQLPLVKAFKSLQDADVHLAIDLIEAHPISWEMIPDRLITDKRIWAALVGKGLPQTALMRQLPRLTNMDLLNNGTFWNHIVVKQLQDRDALKKGRIHPINVLMAMNTYTSGQGERNSWQPVPSISDALNEAFYNAYDVIEPTGKKLVLALDISGSMNSAIPGPMRNGRRKMLPLSCREASAALAMVTARTEENYDIIGFSDGQRGAYGRQGFVNDRIVSRLDISPQRRLDDIVRYTRELNMAGTDLALPMIWAHKYAVQADAFVIYTDNETWYGNIHPHQALRMYREQYNPKAKLIVVSLTANKFSVADPSDPGMLDVVGFDATVPGLISEFVKNDSAI
jgi:60 kDa SS-A/Ro ribonucleoprotein